MAGDMRQIGPSDLGSGGSFGYLPGQQVGAGNVAADGQSAQRAAPPLPPPVDIAAALARIKARCKNRVQSKCCPVMSPLDENTYFDTPKETTAALALYPAVNQVAPADPNRVGIFFALQSTVSGFLTTSPSPGSGQGFQLSTQDSKLFLTQKEYGSLVAMAWFAYVLSPQPANLTIWQLTLRQWPGLQSSYSSTGITDGGSTLAGSPGETGDEGGAGPVVTSAAKVYRRPPPRRIHIPRKPLIP